jgi:hypothetical protein
MILFPLGKTNGVKSERGDVKVILPLLLTNKIDWETPKKGKGTRKLMDGLEPSSLAGRRVSPTAWPKGMKALRGTAVTVGERRRANNTAPRPAHLAISYTLYIVQPLGQESRICQSIHRHCTINERKTPDSLKVAVHQYA